MAEGKYLHYETSPLVSLALQISKSRLNLVADGKLLGQADLTEASTLLSAQTYPLKPLSGQNTYDEHLTECLTDVIKCHDYNHSTKHEAASRQCKFTSTSTFRAPFIRIQAGALSHLHVKTVGCVDDVINEGGLALVERLHGSAATVVLDPLQNQTHDVDAVWREKHSRVVKMLEQKLLLKGSS